MTGAQAFPGGTSVTRLSVYDYPAVDGLRGGTPHMHTVSTEGYVVISGIGALQTIDTSGFHETPLAEGSVVWFTPGTIHRAVNQHRLEVLAIMSNAGLPEAGDAVMTFPDDIVSDPQRYREAARLPSPDAPLAEQDEAARIRCALGVRGFLELRAAIEAGEASALARFSERAARLVRPRVPEWREIFSSTVAPETAATDAALTALDAGDASRLTRSRVLSAPEFTGVSSFGMCGRLRRYDVKNASVIAGVGTPSPGRVSKE